MMSRKVILLFCFICSVLDISVSTVFFAHADEYHHFFTMGVYSYSFNGSLFDLWVLGLLRSVILLGVVIGVFSNPRDAIQRVLTLKPFLITISILMWSFNIMKLLLISEVQSLKQPWLWALLGWTAVMSVLLTVNWILLIKFVQSRGPLKSGHHLIESKPDESQPSVNSNLPNGDAGKSSPESGDASMKKKEEKISRASLMRLIANSAPDWPILLCGFFFLVAAAVGEIFVPHFTGLVINSIVIDKSYSKFVSSITFMALISLGSAIATGLRGGCFVLAISRLNIRLRNRLFSSVVNQEIGFFDKVRTGDITSRLTSDITTMSDMLGLNVNIFLRSSIKAVGVIIFMVKLSWRSTGVTVISMPIIVGVSKLYGSYYKKLAEMVQDSLAAANEVAEEVCSSIRTVRSFANEKGEATRYATALGETYRLKKKQAVAYAGYAWCTQLFDLALTVAVLYYGGHLVLNSVITGGNLVTFILYQIELGNCIQNMGSVYTGLMQAAGAAEKVFEYIDRQPDICNGGQYEPGSLQGSLEFRNVQFSYPTRPETPVLKELSFGVSPGEVVALVGPSGGGKSSCVNLLQHFYECGSGQVLLDGVPVQSYSHNYLHHKMALVGQEPVLYARSLFDNIGYGLDSPTQAAVVSAAKLANAHGFITDLPAGYSTKSGEKGSQLSGGQKQRVAIARALIRNPVILILDEATSALDSESEHLVQNAIYQNLKGRTVVIIAHRLSTVERADRIIVIDKGTIVQQGTHSDLLQEGGLYATLVQRQLLAMDSQTCGGGGELSHSSVPVPVRRFSSENLSSSFHSSDSISLLHVGGSRESPLQVSFKIGSQ